LPPIARNRNWRKRCICRASGLTILEILIALAMLIALTSLLLPAILAARESGRDTHCVDQLHEIGVALHGYEKVHGVLPAGWMLEPTASSAYGWATAILPQLNEVSLSGRIDRSRPITDVSPAVRAMTPSVFLCPSDYGDPDFPLLAELGAHGASFQQSTTLLVTLPRANYMGMFGTSEPDEVAGDSGDGIFIEGHGFRFDEISRGLSHVLMVGERTTRKLHSTWLGIAMHGEDATGRITGCAHLGPNRVRTDECEFDSRHDGHVNFVWADGHVTGVSDKIDLEVYKQCAQRQ
jgi:prepilin-type processing-associated H-X9-DG protein